MQPILIGFDNVDIITKWILRIDADEFISGFEDFNFFIESR